jgi:glycosyltransferase involved in cell wall biosynthesis
MPLTVLGVAYNLAPVGPDAVGGAEQILSAIDRALVAAGHRSIVVGIFDSQVAETLIPTGPMPAHIGEDERIRAGERHRQAIAQALAQFSVDVVHSHAFDFADHLPETDVSTLVTLHLPRDFYPMGSVPAERPRTWYNCVSASQRRSFPPFAAMLPEVENGVPVEPLQAHDARRDFALCLGRICPEKGYEHALEAARLAQIPLLIGGQVFPYESYRCYFESEIRPRLGARAHFLGPPRMDTQAPAVECGPLSAGTQSGGGDELARRHGGDSLRHSGDRVSGRCSCRDSRNGCDRISRPQC